MDGVDKPHALMVGPTEFTQVRAYPCRPSLTDGRWGFTAQGCRVGPSAMYVRNLFRTSVLRVHFRTLYQKWVGYKTQRGDTRGEIGERNSHHWNLPGLHLDVYMQSKSFIRSFHIGWSENTKNIAWYKNFMAVKMYQWCSLNNNYFLSCGPVECLIHLFFGRTS